MLFESTGNIRRALCRTAGRGMEDAAAELDLAAWELIIGGVTDRNELYVRMWRQLRTSRRREARPRNIAERLTATGGEWWVDPFTSVDERLDRDVQLAAFPIPESARPWVARRFGGAQVELTAAQYKSGQRWLDRQQKVCRAAA